MANIATSYKIIGPFTPRDFGNLSTLTTAINTAAGTLGDAGDTNELIDSVSIKILGNIFIKLTWVVT